MIKPILDIDTKPLVDYIISLCRIPDGVCFENESPKLKLECPGILPYPIDVGFNWKTDDHHEDWKTIGPDLLENFAIYLLNNWVRFGFFLSEDGNFNVVRDEGVNSTHETLAAFLKNQEAP
jgi:hypothetical protein